MIKIVKTNSKNVDFIELVRQLDIYLAEKDGEEHSFYDQFNKIDSINNVIVLYDNDSAVACGAIKKYDDDTMEVKRMFTKLEARGKGFAGIIIDELEKWAFELSYNKCILETGVRQKEAIQFYNKSNYKVIPNYGQYIGVENSICFQKELI
ncbi:MULTISPECIES: GNAT family N-acetyltransferase [Flavobacterium]|uniref:GNAT family N-acetyltransferase n=1 Tax=Flavobacterium jumunjinense TaxID=998845 RepID=A0ABV5GT93_9FLAO|nr:MULTISPECIES: GNAT family N-acetyltransferase [Flavobacterium]